MIILDDKYRLENNNIHGVQLVFEETRQKEKRQTKEEKESNTPKVLEDYQFQDYWYYPNPILALKQYIALTNNPSVNNLDELEKLMVKQNEILEKIYKIFVDNKRKV